MLRKSVLFFILLFIQNKVYSQDSASYNPPEFIGGMSDFHNYLNWYLRYPAEEQANNRQGNVIATIFVSKEGKITDVKTEGKNEAFCNAVKRVLSLMPDWQSGKINLDPVDTFVTKTFYFSIGNSRLKKDKTIYECMITVVKMGIGEMMDTYNDEVKEKKKTAASRDSAQKMYNKGLLELQKNNFSDALTFFNSAEDLGGVSIDMLYNRGITYYKLEKRKCLSGLERSGKIWR